MTRIDLNADLGELPGEGGRALDRGILAHVSSANVACGGHAGDRDTMLATFEAAKAAGVRAGAHPSYPDRDGFGRTSLAMPPESLAQTLDAQVGAAITAAAEVGITLCHLKPHGALYHDARGATVAGIVAACAKAHGLALYGPPTGQLARAAMEWAVRYVAEGFADRAYRGGKLVARSEPGAVLEDAEKQTEQALRLALGEVWPDGPSGARIETLCLHGDTPGAARAAALLRTAIEAAGIDVAPPR